MAYVAPHGIIELYYNIPLNRDQTNTLYFASEQEQRTYFQSRFDSRYTNQMYTRVHGNRIRVNTKADDLYNVNYLGFKNENKWFYAFVTKVEYINEQVSEITFQLDNIQTWFLNVIWYNSFIERQHSLENERLTNLQPEPVNCDEHICIKQVSDGFSPEHVHYILSLGTVNKSSGASGSLYSVNTFNGISSTVKYLYFTTPSELISFLNACEFNNGFFSSLLNTGDLWAPLTLYAVPEGLFPHGSPIPVGNVNVSLLSQSITVENIDIDLPEEHGFGGSYEPVNKKLLTYPYTYFEIEAVLNSQQYKYETFYRPASGKPRLRRYCTCNPVPTLVIVPEAYNGQASDFKYSITVDDFPQLQIYSSGFWGGAGSGIASIIKGAIVALLTGSLGAGAAAGASGGNANTYALTVQDNSKLPMPVTPTNEQTNAGVNTGFFEIPKISTAPNLRGSGGISNMAPLLAYIGHNGTSGSFGFEITAYQWGLREEFARMIDEYFHKYGYAQNRIAKPNIHARANWTFVKTRDCYIGGNIPSEARVEICNAMNKGITWWADTANVGSYVYGTTGDLRPNPTL